ncbi:autophagy-related protein 5 [Paracoccidioides lutzii Pb01]|uniref:Autophagy protein 5 n=1 Tax=Paracoccidioides lutzii (strain ATCC MYA-826 / Pb01) TaxID=502779 RepID=C1H6Q8_PARBA|nr:autophagy-related protein 5 [Paracoccidioides lutzii Pb01]EEH35402.1 autophagy-related protein 5 [Paracoccidioides lutzii Pb01]
MGSPTPSPNAIQRRVWDGRIPLEITLSPSECRTYDKADPYLICYPRVSYLPFLLPRLHAFFASWLIDIETQPHQGWFSFEGVPLKWHYPLGLLYDLYSGADPVTSKSSVGEDVSHAVSPGEEDDSDHHSEHEHRKPIPWRLQVHFSDWPDQELVRLDADGRVIHDAFINSVKEADFVRNGTAKGIMTLSKEDSSGLWQAVQDHNFTNFQRISNILIPSPPNQFRNIPLRIFLPSPPNSATPSLKVIQSLFPPTIQPSTSQSGAPGRPTQSQPQTVGSSLNSLLPSLFPSKRIPVLAKPVLQGAVVPLIATLEEVVRVAGYADGWLAIVVTMVG